MKYFLMIVSDVRVRIGVIICIIATMTIVAAKYTPPHFSLAEERTNLSYSEAGPVPTLVFTKPDCVLVIYNGDSPRLGADAELLNKIKELGVKRVVTYPESYTPILVPEEEVANIKKLLGDRCLRISPKLE